MLVKELMSKNPTYVSPEATLKEASQEMEKRNCGFIPIGANDRLIGAVTDRDITVRGTAKGLDPTKTKILDVMTMDILWCYENDSVEQAAKLMKVNHVHRLAVLNSDKRLTGVLSVRDLVKTHDAMLCGELVEGILEF